MFQVVFVLLCDLEILVLKFILLACHITFARILQ
jgi:hypothetical protein